MTLNYWMDVFGQSPIAVRLYSVLIGVATIGVVFLLARDWFGESTALAAALITAVAPFHVQYSQETRMYALLMLLLLLATWVYWRAWQRGRPVYWLVFGVLAGISMYAQQLAGFYLVALGLLPFLARDRKRIIWTVLASLLSIIIYLPWLLNLPDQMGKLRQYWIKKPSVLHIWLALRSFTSVNLDFAAIWWLPTFLIAAVLTIFLLYRGYRLWRSRDEVPDRQPFGWALWLAFVPMILMWIGSYVFQPVFLPRALLPSAGLFYIALAWLFVRGGLPRVITAILILGWGVVIVFGLITLYTWDTFPNPPFDDAADYLREHHEADDVIVHGNKITALPMVYYERDLPQRYVRDIPGSGSDTLAVPTQEALQLLADDCMAQSAGGAPRLWYVAFEQLENEMRDLVEDDPRNSQYDSLNWLRAHYHQADLFTFDDLNIFLFVEPDAEAVQASCTTD
jgi:hypothetical protein